MKEDNKMEKIVSLSKRRGFIFQGSEIYGGLAGTWDYGPLGIALKRNISNLWWKRFVEERDDMYGVDAAILMKKEVWEASGHVGGFSDPLVECEKCKKRFRADHLEDKEKCPDCGGDLGEERQFNMMFETQVGAQGDTKSYLRPETAQGMFVNFKNIVDTMRPKLPFGMAQIGKAFRNEISPRDFIFRTREFEQMEIEYFIDEKDWEKQFEYWLGEMRKWISDIGLSEKKINELEVPEDDRAHYSKRTVDFEYDFPFGMSELYGLAYRTDYDLSKHTEHSGEKMVHRDVDGKEYTPHVIEPTFGVDRTVLAVLAEAYTEDEMGRDVRAFLKLKPELAPIKAAVFPLMKNKPELVKKAREVYEMLKKDVPQIMWDDNGNVGKRYRRQDEIGTPVCITIDFDTIEDDTVTVRDRDTGEQERVKILNLTDALF
jgi:glycyl-tRNA synthetase